jgi:hypothetical protein
LNASLTWEFAVGVPKTFKLFGFAHPGLQSNLDRDLLSVLKDTTNVATLVPADSAGLRLARAVSVVSVLRGSRLLAGFKLIPLSGAQLVNTDETRPDPAHAPPGRFEIHLRLKCCVNNNTDSPRLTLSTVVGTQRDMAVGEAMHA